MVRKRFRWRTTTARAWGGPSPVGTGLSHSRGGLAGRTGAGPLIAVALASALLALVLCAVFVPGFVLGAEPDLALPTAEAAGLGPFGGKQLVTLPWGDGPGEVGLAQPVEGLARGPEALAVAPDGRIAVLDTMNSRLVVLAQDGSLTDTIPLRMEQPRFLAVDDGVIYVLDSDTSRRLVCLDWQGTELASTLLPTLDDVVTGLFAIEGGACVEIAHDKVFLVEIRDGGIRGPAAEHAAPAALRALAGRPIDRDVGNEAKVTFEPKQGLKLKRFRVDKKTFKAVQTQASTPSFSARREVEHLVSLDGDGKGGLVFGARLLHPPGAGDDSSCLLLGRLPGFDQPGVSDMITQTLALREAPFAYLGQPYTVAPDGRVFQPVGTEAGYTILIHSLPDAPADEEVQP